MKNITIIKFLLPSCLLLLLTACSDLIEKEPLDQLIDENFYQSPEDANRAVTACYAPIHGTNWYGKSWMMTEIPADNATTGGNDPDFLTIDNFTVNGDNVPNAEFWAEHYVVIVRANQVLEKIPDIDMDEATRAAILGEAKFLRAFSYFDLVRMYGGVPLITEVQDIYTDFSVPRSTAEQVYELIIADLTEGIGSLPAVRNSAEAGRATSGAAKALLSKVYLTTKDYAEAMELTREIIASNRYRLMDTYDENWLKETSDNNEESIFQLQYTGCGPGGTGNALQAFFAPFGQGITKNSDGWGSQTATSGQADSPGTTIRDAFEEGDLRQYHTIMTPGDFYPMINPEDGGFTYPPTRQISRTGVSIKKYVIGGGPDVCFMSSPQNVHVIRYADVLLSLAEASCAIGGGVSITPDVLEAFNAVRTRAGLDSVTSVTSEMVFQERRVEFAFENQRWFDLLRSGNAIETLRLHGKSLDEHNLLFPIPNEELAVNKNLTQNPGY